MEKRGIHGHGLRARMVLGQLGVGEPRGVHEVELRRYRCLSCRAILVVGPWDLLPGMLYSLVTVVLALAQWGMGTATGSVRARLGAFAVVGLAGRLSWRSLRRWASRAAPGQVLERVDVSLGGTMRERAARWVHIVAGAGPPSHSLPLRALVGARHHR